MIISPVMNKPKASAKTHWRSDDAALIERFVKSCADRDMTLLQMAESIGKTKTWASLLVRGKVKTLKWQTANRIARYLNGLS